MKVRILLALAAVAAAAVFGSAGNAGAAAGAACSISPAPALVGFPITITGTNLPQNDFMYLGPISPDGTTQSWLDYPDGATTPTDVATFTPTVAGKWQFFYWGFDTTKPTMKWMTVAKCSVTVS